MKWLDTLVQYAQANLQGSRELEELWSRGVSDDQISSYQLGYLDQALPPLPGADDFLDWCHRGVKLNDVFVLPLTNSLGQIKGAQFRHVERSMKGYMDYFAAEDEPIFFGLAQAMPHLWETDTVCLVEGAFDLFPMQRLVPGTIATLTSKVSRPLYKLLRRNASTVLMGYDIDKPGKDGTIHFIKEYGPDFAKVKVPGGQGAHPWQDCPTVRMSNGKAAKDISDIWEALGDDAFGVYMRTAFAIQ